MVKIVVLQRGWVVVGQWSRDGDDCTLTNASVIRKWGTETGLGQIAQSGPTNRTVLDPAGTIHYDQRSMIMTIDCVDDVWLR